MEHVAGMQLRRHESECGASFGVEELQEVIVRGWCGIRLHRERPSESDPWNRIAAATASINASESNGLFMTPTARRAAACMAAWSSPVINSTGTAARFLSA